MPDERDQEDNERITFSLINNDIKIPVFSCFLDVFMLYANAQASQAAIHTSTTYPFLQCYVLFIFRRNGSNNSR